MHNVRLSLFSKLDDFYIYSNEKYYFLKFTENFRKSSANFNQQTPSKSDLNE